MGRFAVELESPITLFLKGHSMPTIQNLRRMYRTAFVVTFALIGFSLHFSSMALKFSHDLPDASRTSCAAAIVLCLTGMLGGVLAGALKMIVWHIELLERELAKIAESEADFQSAARALADFLQQVGPPKTPEPPHVMRAVGRFCRRLLGTGKKGARRSS
jgi:hypothetical protein